MKNIHLLPTENESRIRYSSFNKVYELCKFPKYHTDIKSTHNIYITSDEEIKNDDWVYDAFDKKTIYKATDVVVHDIKSLQYPYCKKIILTADQDLIADGVQAIDDEFLEWFVKNPSCEEVELESELRAFDIKHNEVDYEYEIGAYTRFFYKIIIPKEERERGITITHIGKQETLEEAAERFTEVWFKNNAFASHLFIEGAKWQAENSNINALNFEIDALKKQIELLKYQEQDKNKFSKDDIIEAFYTDSREWKNSCKDYVEVDFNKWFEKFKKK